MSIAEELGPYHEKRIKTVRYVPVLLRASVHDHELWAEYRGKMGDGYA